MNIIVNYYLHLNFLLIYQEDRDLREIISNLNSNR